MTTYNTNVLPNTTGLDLGSDTQRWDGFFNNIFVTGSLNGAPASADSVQVISVTQSVGFASGLHTLILAAGGSAPGITLALPAPSPFSGRRMHIKKTDLTLGFVTISGVIDNGSSYVLSNQYQYVVLESGNGSWWVVANN